MDPSYGCHRRILQPLEAFGPCARSFSAGSWGAPTSSRVELALDLVGTLELQLERAAEEANDEQGATCGGGAVRARSPGLGASRGEIVDVSGQTIGKKLCGIRVIDVEDRGSILHAELEDLRPRVAATRWPEREPVADPSQGVQLATMALTRYWGSE